VTAAAPRRLLAIVTDALEGPEPIDELQRQPDGGRVEVRVVVPAVEATPFRHTLGDIDEPKREAEDLLRASLDSLRRSGVSASGGVGDPDPVQAAADALREAPADEVLIFEHEEGQARWFENGLFERAQESIEPPLRMVVVHSGEADGDHVVAVEKAGRGIEHHDENEIGSAYLPGLSRRDLAGMVIGIVGTLVAAILAAAGPGPDSGWGAASILIAIAIALVNLAHVVGLTLFESVRYRGGFAKLFRTVALVGTPAAVLANLLILLLA
jgi:hypothetical protein